MFQGVLSIAIFDPELAGPAYQIEIKGAPDVVYDRGCAIMEAHREVEGFEVLGSISSYPALVSVDDERSGECVMAMTYKLVDPGD